MNLRENEALQLIDSYIRRYKAALWLNDWRVRFVLASLEDAQAQTEIDQIEYKQVNITFDLQRIPNKATLLEVIRHELIHVLGYPYMHVLNQAAKLVQSRGEEALLNEAIRQAHELFATHLENVLGASEENLLYIPKEQVTMKAKPFKPTKGSKGGKGGKGKAPMDGKFEGGKPKKGSAGC